MHSPYPHFPVPSFHSQVPSPQHPIQSPISIPDSISLSCPVFKQIPNPLSPNQSPVLTRAQSNLETDLRFSIQPNRQSNFQPSPQCNLNSKKKHPYFRKIGAARLSRFSLLEPRGKSAGSRPPTPTGGGKLFFVFLCLCFLFNVVFSKAKATWAPFRTEPLVKAFLVFTSSWARHVPSAEERHQCTPQSRTKGLDSQQHLSQNAYGW